MREDEFLRMLVDAEKTYEAIAESLTDGAATKIGAALSALREARDTGPEATALLRGVADVVESLRAQLVGDRFISGPPLNDAD